MSAFVLLSYSLNVSPSMTVTPAIHIDTVGVWVEPVAEGEITYKSVIAAIKEQHFDTLKAERESMTEERYAARQGLLRTLRMILSAQTRKLMPTQGPIQLVEAPSEVRLYSLVHTLMVTVQWYED